MPEPPTVIGTAMTIMHMSLAELANCDAQMNDKTPQWFNVSWVSGQCSIIVLFTDGTQEAMTVQQARKRYGKDMML